MRAPTVNPTANPTARPTVGPTGMTLVEVLVALVVLAVLSTAASGLLIGAARLQASAATSAARVEALDPYLVAVGARIEGLPACPAPAGAEEMTGACHAGSRRCRLDAGRIVCDGGPIVRSRLRALAGGRLGPEVEVWSVAP